jgi:hypothetical protein
VTAAPPIRLLFTGPVSDTTRSRITYAFRVFAAIYNYHVVDGEANQEARTLFYGNAPSLSGVSNGLQVPARYTPRTLNGPLASLSKIPFAGEDFYLFHGVDPSTGRADWFGEIFEWLSSSHERDIPVRDSVGRIPNPQMIFDRAGLPPWKPQAALQMAWLEHSLRNARSEEALPKAPSPVADANHLVVCSHDVDFYFTNRRNALVRLVKNLGISWLVYRSSSYLQSTFEMIGKLLAGNRVGEYLPSLMARMERHGARSTFFIVPVHGHRRDPNYTLAKLVPQIREALKKGFPVEIHGSYESIIENRTLLPDSEALQRATGKKALGSRQHWLRFDDHEKLFQAIEEAELLFDSSLGFPETVGFRNGACFAFPPYDFQNERPHNFLEIPLAIMDGSLVELSRSSGEAPQNLAQRVLGESRKRGWGGISVLWHNPVEALSVPKEINQIFWDCLEARNQFQEKWVSTDQFLSLCLPRYQNAGLLQNARLVEQPAPDSLGQLLRARS